jgi:hypothetical protein
MPDYVADELAKLATLRDAGVLNVAEFDRQKARLLAPSGDAPSHHTPPQSATESTGDEEGTPSNRHRARWAFATLLALIVLVIAIVSSGNSSKPPTLAGQVSSFNSLVRTIKGDLSVCTAAASNIQIELGLILQNSTSVSQSDLVTLDTDSKNAQTACDEVDNNDILNLGTMSLSSQLASLQSLQGVPSEANNWATNDTTAVLHDIQNIAESTGSTVENDSKLQSDTAKGDQDANALNSQLSQSAQQLGITGAPSIGLVTWTSAGTPTTTFPPVAFTTLPPPKAGTQPAFDSSVPTNLAKALAAFFSNPSNSGAPIGELAFSVRIDSQAPNWGLYEVQGKPAYTSNIQGGAGLVEEVNGVWTVYAPLGSGDSCVESNVPTSVASFFKLKFCSS